MNGPKKTEIKIVLLVSESVFENRLKELSTLCGSSEPESSDSASHVLHFNKENQIVIYLFSDYNEAAKTVEKRPVDAVLIDNREAPPPKGFTDTMAGKILPMLLAYEDPGRSVNRGSIFVILPSSDATPHHAFAVGSLQLGGVLVEPPSIEFAVLSTLRVVSPSEPGKVALCLAGGGIEGMIYEMGALRALDAHLRGRTIVDFDIFSGISAGAIIGAFLANGIHPEEMSDSIHGKPSRVSPITRSLLFDPNLGEITSRVMGSFGDFVRGQWLKKPIEAALKITPSALFSGEKMKWHLEKELTKPGMTNDFNQLKKELYIGASDQDSGAHVTFGSEGLRDIPISHALRASAAMTPYYPPEKIKDRYYIDGIFTRTINLDIAVASGASLIICVDPLTPVQVETAGYVSDRGGFFNTVQSVKSLIRTRFFEVIDRAEEAYPNVDVCVFSPTRQDLEQMSMTMMRFMHRSQVEEMAYQSVSRRIKRDIEWLAGDFSRHGFELVKEPG